MAYEGRACSAFFKKVLMEDFLKGTCIIVLFFRRLLIENDCLLVFNYEKEP